jgi:hypothetical protein
MIRFKEEEISPSAAPKGGKTMSDEQKKPKSKAEDLAAAGMPAPDADESKSPEMVPAIPEDPAEDEELGDVEEDELRDYEIDEADAEDAIESSEGELRKTSALPPSAWIHSPARVQLLIEGIKVLGHVAKLRKSPATKFPYVRLMLLTQKKLLLVAPTTEKDSKAIETSRTGKGPLYFNAVTVLQPANLTVTKGYKERYKVGRAATSPIGPALVIDLNKSVESTILKRGKGKDDQTNKGNNKPK